MNLIKTIYNPESAEVTEIRRLYSKLRTLHLEQQCKNLLVTSATIGEGKSTTASLLASTIAFFRGTRTLLVDCDLRRPRIHELFGCDRDMGVADLLTGRMSLESCFKDTHIPNLKLLTGGRVSASPAEIFSSRRLPELFSEIKFYFDSIVIDSPPVIPVSDTLFLSAEADGVLMVVKAGVTPRQVAKRAVDMLRDARVPLLGVVINNMEEALPYYYDYSYYGYQYYRPVSETGAGSN